MKPIVKIICIILLILAVMAYTIYNYTTGKTDSKMFLVSIGLLGYVLIGMVNQLIQHLKNK